VVELSDKAYNEDAFLLVPVDEEEITDLLFIHTSISILSGFAAQLRSKKAQKGNTSEDISKDKWG
jgi:hypothetical protein